MKNYKAFFIALITILTTSTNSLLCVGGFEYFFLKRSKIGNGYHTMKNPSQEELIFGDIPGDLKQFAFLVLDKKFIKNTLCCCIDSQEESSETVGEKIEQKNNNNNNNE